MKIFKPKFWDYSYYSFFSLLLLPLSFIYQILFFLKKTIASERKFSLPIICVGNIYVGGTGKTPVSIKIYEILKKLNFNPVVIKKDYEEQKDEISLIEKHGQVLISKKREDAISKAIDKKFDCAVLDDGYQDFTVKKNINIICFNLNQKIGNGLILPAGPLRESLKSLKNCHIVMINGEKNLDFENKLKKYNNKLTFFYFNYYSQNVEQFKNKKLLAFAGIGNPDNFFDFLKLYRLNVVKEIRYPDHFKYNEKELDHLKDLEKKYNGKLITTEKDYLRIDSFFRKRVSFLPIKINILEEEKLKEKVKNLLNENN